MRPGNAGAKNAEDHIALIRNACRALPGSECGGNNDHRILVRTDGADGTKNVAPYLHKRCFAYSLGISINDKIGTLESTLPEQLKQDVLRPGADGEVTDIDTAYGADITGLPATGKTEEHGINLDRFPPITRVIIQVEYPAADRQLRITDDDARRVTTFITDSADEPQVLDLRHRDRGRCERQIKDTKDLSFLVVPHHSFAANQIWMHAVFIAGALLI